MQGYTVIALTANAISGAKEKYLEIGFDVVSDSAKRGEPEEKGKPEDTFMICALLEMLRITMQEMKIDEVDEVELLRTAVED